MSYNEFDKNGYIYPHKVIETTIEDFERFFVLNLEDGDHRRFLFQNYLSYVNAFKTIVNGSFYQLINGSFITRKNKPGDIDIVTFMDYKIIEAEHYSLKFFMTNSKSLYLIDGYFAPICNAEHVYSQKAIEIEKYWLNLFGKSGEDETGNRYPKGIIKILF